jgi:hypothetical protein
MRPVRASISGDAAVPYYDPDDVPGRDEHGVG